MIKIIKKIIHRIRQHHLIRHNPQLKEIIKYLIVGNSANLLDFILYICLTRVYSYWMAQYLIANIITMVIASLVRFYFHKKWTFRDDGKYIELQYFKFITILFITFIINILVIYYTVEHLYVNDLLAKLIASVIGSLILFLVSRSLIFKNKKPLILLD